jgi:uncharacterized delta-60 repeat protein
MRFHHARSLGKRRLQVEALEERTLLNAGFIDTSFGNQGVAVLDLGGAYTASPPTAAAVQTDGKIVAVSAVTPTGASAGGQEFILVARFNADGSLDTTFDGKGYEISAFLAVPTDVALQSNGDIVVAGNTIVAGVPMAGQRRELLLVRYNPDGSLDTHFGTGGVVTTAVTTQSDSGGSLAVQADGKLVLTGTGLGIDVSTVDVVRYNSDGTLDTTFGSGGIAVALTGSATTGNSGVLVQPDGKIVVAATPTFLAQSAWEVLRYNTDGSPDQSFGSTGLVMLNHGTSGSVAGVALQADGKLIVDGFLGNGAGMARLNADGSLDTTFGTSGQVATAVAGTVVVQPNGPIVLLGTANFNAAGAPELVRYLANGQLDTTFGNGGQSSPLPPFAAAAQGPILGLALQPDGELVVAGIQQGMTTPNLAVARYQGDPLSQPSQHYVAQLYLDLLGRPADPAGLGFWVRELDWQHVPRSQVVLGIENSLEYHRDVVEKLYRQYLHRDADPAGLNNWTNFLGSGGTIDGLRAKLLGSAEYFADAGGSNNTFLKALYQDVLNRSIDSGGAQTWGQALQNGTSREVVAAAILASLEQDRDQVQGLYQWLLHRSADPGGLQTFVQELQRGTPSEQMVAAIAGSPEYFLTRT